MFSRVRSNLHSYYYHLECEVSTIYALLWAFSLLLHYFQFFIISIFCNVSVFVECWWSDVPSYSVMESQQPHYHMLSCWCRTRTEDTACMYICSRVWVCTCMWTRVSFSLSSVESDWFWSVESWQSIRLSQEEPFHRAKTDKQSSLSSCLSFSFHSPNSVLSHSSHPSPFSI